MNDKSRFGIVLFIFFLSGASALVYEVVWIRSLEILFGSSTSAVATVLAVYMGGLAVGAAFLSRISDRFRVHPFLIYSGLEVGIAVCAVILPYLFPLAGQLYGDNYSVDGPNTAGTALRFGLITLFLLVPTMLMGATFPVMVKGLTAYFPKNQWQKLISSLYGMNTLGAVCGVFLAGFILLRFMGLSQTNLTAVALNLVAAVTALTLWRFGASMAAPDSGTESTPNQMTGVSFPQWTIVVVAFVTGFSALSCEVVWTRVLKLIFAGTTFSVSIMLMSFLAGIGLGSMITSRWKGNAHIRIPLLLVGFGVFTAIGVPLVFKSVEIWGFIIRSLTPDDSSATWGQAVTGRFLLSALIMFVPALMSGAIFPQLATMVSQSVGLGKGMAQRVGSVFAMNTVGGVCGSLATGFLLIPRLGTRGTVLLSAILLISLGIFLLIRTVRPLHWKFGVTAGAAIMVLIYTITSFSGVHYIGKLREWADTQVLFFNEGIGASVIVVQNGTEGQKRLYTNGSFAVGTSLESLQTVGFLGQLPCIFAQQTDDALVIGMGMGVTLASVASHPFTDITCVEIIPGVYDAARNFTEFNDDVLDDPRIRTVVEDGYSYLKWSDQTYDVITCDPIHPAFGSPTLYTREFYELCMDHLNPGGALAQYIPIHQLCREDFQLLVRTFMSVFPNCVVFMGLSHGVLIAREDSVELDVDKLASLFAVTEETAYSSQPPSTLLERIGIYSPAKLLATVALDTEGLREISGPGPINTLNHTRLEFSESRSYGHDTRVENLAMILNHPPDLATLVVQPEAAWPGDMATQVRILQAGRRHLLQGYYNVFNRNQKAALHHARMADVLLDGDMEVMAAVGVNVIVTAHFLHAKAALTQYKELQAKATVDNATERAQLQNIVRISLERALALQPDHRNAKMLLDEVTVLNDSE